MKDPARTVILRSLKPEIGERSAARREALQISRPALATLVGVTAPTINAWEAGEIPDTLATSRLEAWESALQAPAGWLVSPQGKELPEPVIAPATGDSAEHETRHLIIPPDVAVAMGARARARREKLGASRETVAGLVGIGAATIMRWERGDLSRMRVENLSAWEDALRAPRRWLLDPKVGAVPLADIGPRSILISAESFSDAISQIAAHLARPSRRIDQAPASEKATTSRDVQLLASRYGVNGPRTTLEEIAAPFGITRERARQIIDRMIEVSGDVRFEVPLLATIRVAVDRLLPCPAALLTESLRPFLGERLSVEDASAFARDLLGASFVRLSEPVPGGIGPRIDGIAYALDDPDGAALDDMKIMRSLAFGMIRSCGVAHLPTIAGRAALNHDVKNAAHAKVLMAIEGFEWLDSDKSWFWFGPETPSRTIIASIARKVFSVARKNLDVTDLVTAVMRYRNLAAFTDFRGDRSLMIIPPVHVTRALLERLDWLEAVQHDDFRAKVAINRAEELSETELRLVSELELLGGIGNRFELRTVMPDVKKVTFDHAMGSSPVVRLLCRGVYGLIGWPVDPEAFARSIARRDAALNHVDVTRTPDGRVCFPFLLTEFAVDSKACFVPAEGVRLIPVGTYRVSETEATVDCVSRSSGGTVINRLVQQMLALGYDAGDIVNISISPQTWTITLSPADAPASDIGASDQSGVASA